MATERLPFGEIRPGARPIGSFLQPIQLQTQNATAPSQLGNPSGITQLQMASSGSVQGYNQYSQLAEALAPFNRQITSLLEKGITSYVSDQIQGGYQDYQRESLRNQVVRSTLNLQMQQEQGAANAATMQGQLEKVDPIAADLLRDSNPWRLVGRRRAAAQLAGGEIDSTLATDYELNQGTLAGIAPGSPALKQRRAALTQGILSRYGLTGEEPEAMAYLVPKLNKAWDDYATKHAKLYGETLRTNTTALTTSSLGRMLEEYGRSGIPFQGEVIGVADPRFPAVAGAFLTSELDKSLSMFGGKDRADALQQIRTQLLGTYGQVPVLGAALSFIQGGNPGDKARPTWGATYGLEILETTNRGNNARQQAYQLGQQGIEQKLDELWWGEGMPGSMLPADPGQTAALQRFRTSAAAMGYRDPDGYIKKRMDSQTAVAAAAYRPDPLAAEDFMTQVDALPRAALSSPQAIEALRQKARDAARAEPTPELQASRYREYSARINQRAKDAAETTPGLVAQIDQELLTDLGLPLIKAKVDAGKSAGQQSAFEAALMGNRGTAAAVGSLGNAAVSAFTNRVQNLYLRNSEAAIDRWQAENPGVPLSSTVRNTLISGAIAETRKGKEYAAAYQQLTGKKPGEVGSAQVGTGPSNQGEIEKARGVPRSAARTLKPSTIGAYATRPVLDGDWIYDELSRVANGKPVSAQLFGLAKAAGTSTNRYLYEQLRFYPQLDPKGEARQFLQQQVLKQRAGQTVSSANLQGVMMRVASSLMGEQPAAAAELPAAAAPGRRFNLSAQTRPRPAPQATPGEAFNPLAPGSWLMNMIMPAASATRLPASYSRFDGGGGGGGDYVATTGFGYSADRKTQTLHGIQGRPGYDANHGVGNDHVHHGANDPQTAMALAQYLKARGWPITEFKPWGRVGRHKDPGHYNGSTFDVPVAVKDHGRVLQDINAFYASRNGGGSRGGGGGNASGYLRRLAYLETRIRNVPNAEGTAGRGYFQAFPAFSQEAIAASGGIDPRDGDYNRSARATWAWIEKHRPAAAAAIRRGDYDAADRILTPTWPSLPGGSQAQPDHVQRAARRYLGGR